ncbi:hypothetical protein KIN20_036861 [Parelaphostrongylus tenuis]|uniref:Uncharacterized protein n=1 Tax=Parelaphostrongylus tenuis TaxID=148309 RepID=A0AAD5WKW4_PARTN|nr:hypothetical protein KIN20_036861 [Parelaphostrongylus tenuis]
MDSQCLGQPILKRTSEDTEWRLTSLNKREIKLFELPEEVGIQWASSDGFVE